MTNKERPLCELVLFHSTTKENLKGIMKDGIKPGMKGGWCDLWIKQAEKEIPPLSKEEIETHKREMEEYKEECKENIFVTSDFHHLEGSEVILILCLPKKMVFVPSRSLQRLVPFEEWINLGDSVDDDILQFIVKETIPPYYIIGYLEIENPEKRVPYGNTGGTTFRINRNWKKVL